MLTKIKNANPFGSLSERKLREFEEQISATLPSDYRDFLKTYNGGEPEPNGFWIVEGYDGSGVSQFYGLHDGPQWHSIQSYVGVQRLSVPESLLVIGDDGVGDQICIGIKNQARGAIYFVDHEIHPSSQLENWRGITKIANSFSEFLSSMREMRE